MFRQPKLQRAFVALLALLFCHSLAQAQIADFQRQQLVNAMRDAATNFDIGQVADADRAKQRFVTSFATLDSFLTRATSEENRSAWLEYLDADPLLDAIEDDDSASSVRRAALALQRRLVGTAPGLEISQIRALRDSVNHLIPAVQYSDKEKTAKLIPRQLESVAKRFEEMESVPSVDDAATANLILGILTNSQQTAYAIDTLKQRFGHPNIAVWVGESLVQRFVYQPINDTRPVRDCILGTRIEGTATMNGAVTANLIPTQGAVGLNVALAGHIVSQNRGFNGPISLRSSANGDVFAARDIFISESGVNFGQTCANASLQSKVHAIEHRLRIVRRIAWKKAGESKPQADRIAQEKMRQQVADQFTEQTNETAGVTPPDLMQKVRPVLLRLDLPEPPRMIGSTDDAAYLRSMIGRTDQLAAPTPAPPIHGIYEGAVQIHESAIDNSLGYLLAGRTVNQAQIDKLLAQAGRAPEPTKTETDDEDDEETKEEQPFEIDFSTVRPVVFEARDGKIRLGVRGTRFAQGSRILKRPIEITVIYTPAMTADGAVLLIREGEVDVDFPGKKRRTITQTGLKTTIKKSFEKVFPDTLLDQPIVVPSTVKSEAIRGRVYRPRSVEANDGWVTVLL